MSSFRIRPRFKHLVIESQEHLEERICEALKKEKQFVCNHLSNHLYIKINAKERHIWSPQLHLSFEEESSERVVVRGLYGPNPTVWAFFFFGYVALGLASLFIGMWGLSMYSLKGEADILWFLPGFGVAAIVLYLISQTGQKLGAQQMFDIHHFYENSVKDKVLID